MPSLITRRCLVMSLLLISVPTSTSSHGAAPRSAHHHAWNATLKPVQKWHASREILSLIQFVSRSRLSTLLSWQRFRKRSIALVAECVSNSKMRIAN